MEKAQTLAPTGVRRFSARWEAAAGGWPPRVTIRGSR